VRAAAVAAAAAGEAIIAASECRAEVGAAAAPPASGDSTMIVKNPRKQRVPITIAVKKQICRLRSQGRTWSSVLATLPTGVSKEAARKVYRARHKWLAMPNDDATEMRTVLRKGHYAGVDDRLRAWLAAIEQLDHKTVPISFGLLQAKAVEIGRALKLDDFRASRGYLRGFLSRTGIKSVKLHGQGGAVDKEAAERGMEVVRKGLEAYRAEDIYNMDETGLFFRSLPSQSYVSAGARREARGIKSMKAKDSVTLVCCTNATGVDKLPIAFIGKSKAPLCFRGAGRTPPVPYFDQSNAWMDSTRFKQWFDRVFVPGTVEGRPRRVALIMDNASSRGPEVGHPQVELIFLPPNSTARHQPMDAGIIAAVKRGYRRRFLGRTVSALGDVVSTAIDEVLPVGPAGGDAAAAPGRDTLAAVQGDGLAGGGGAASVPASVAASPATAAAAPASAPALPAFADTIVVAGPGSAAAVSAWAAAAPTDTDTIIVAGPASAAAVPASSDIIIVAGGPAPAAAYSGPSFVTPRDEYVHVLEDQESSRVVARPHGRPAGWGGGLVAGGAANLMDVAIMVKDAWEELSSSAIAHCWAKTDVLGAIRTVDLLRLHGEYRRTFRSVSDDVDVMLELMQGTSLGNVALAGLDDVAQRAVVEEWMEIEERPAGVVGAADAVVQDMDAAGGDVADSADT